MQSMTGEQRKLLNSTTNSVSRSRMPTIFVIGMMTLLIFSGYIHIERNSQFDKLNQDLAVSEEKKALDKAEIASLTVNINELKEQVKQKQLQVDEQTKKQSDATTNLNTCNENLKKEQEKVTQVTNEKNDINGKNDECQKNLKAEKEKKPAEVAAPAPAKA